MRAHNIMDYSLLFAIEKNEAYNKLKGGPNSKSTFSGSGKMDEETEKILNAGFNKTRHTFLSKNKKYFYHLAIIDYLQDFNLDKKLENTLKTVLNKEGAQISAVPPNPYCNRFVKFMKKEVIIDQKQ